MPANVLVSLGDGTSRCILGAITPENEGGLSGVDKVQCRVQSLEPPLDPPVPFYRTAQELVRQDLRSYPAQRGARMQWYDSGTAYNPSSPSGLSGHSHGGNGVALLSDFDAPMDFEAGRQNSKVFVEGWFEPPVSGPATFFIRGDAAPGATLVWSGNESVYAYETLATSAVSKIGSRVNDQPGDRWHQPGRSL